MQRFKGTKGMLILIVLVCAVIGYYYYISNKPAKEGTSQEETTVVTNVQNVLLRNLERNYPPTPKEVVKYYADITLCFYSEEYTDEELEQLALKIRELYDEEFLAANPEEAYLEELKKDIAEFEEGQYSMSGYYTSSSTDVFFFEEDGYEWARLYCTFYIKKGKNTNVNSEEVFVLRKDEQGHWKIYGWDLADD